MHLPLFKESLELTKVHHFLLCHYVCMRTCIRMHMCSGFVYFSDSDRGALDKLQFVEPILMLHWH